MIALNIPRRKHAMKMFHFVMESASRTQEAERGRLTANRACLRPNCFEIGPQNRDPTAQPTVLNVATGNFPNDCTFLMYAVTPTCQ